MNLAKLSLENRLRATSALLLTLPAIVAAACFAHGHGSVGSYTLLAILTLCIAAGALGAGLLLSVLRPRAHSSSRSGLPVAAANPSNA